LDIHLHIEKKYFYILLVLIVIGFSTMIVFAGHGDSTPYTVSGMFHYLQDVVKGDSLVSVDADNNGAVDSADNCNGSSVCIAKTLNISNQVCIANVCRNTWPADLTAAGTQNYVTKWGAGNTLGDSSIYDNGNIGIGTNNPGQKLDVNGSIKLGNTTTPEAGTIRWTGSDFEGYDGSVWMSLTNEGTKWLVNNQHTKTDCDNAGGTVVKYSGQEFCRFDSTTNIDCPSGWTQYHGWSTTIMSSVSCFDACWSNGFCAGGLGSGTKSCTTNIHPWSNNGVMESCSAGTGPTICGQPLNYCGDCPKTAVAVRIEIGCY